MNNMNSMKSKLSILTIIIAAIIASGCSYQHSLGNGFQAITTSELLAPSATVIYRPATNELPEYIQVIAGQSGVGQIVGPASAVAGGYFIGRGLRKSGGEVNTVQQQGQVAGALAVSGASASVKTGK
jgi:hypothetical protein